MSLSNRPKNVKTPVQDAIHRDVISLRRKFPFMGSAKIKAKLGLHVSCSTVNNILRKANLCGKLVMRCRDKTYGSFERSRLAHWQIFAQRQTCLY